MKTKLAGLLVLTAATVLGQIQDIPVRVGWKIGDPPQEWICFFGAPNLGTAPNTSNNVWRLVKAIPGYTVNGTLSANSSLTLWLPGTNTMTWRAVHFDTEMGTFSTNYVTWVTNSTVPITSSAEQFFVCTSSNRATGYALGFSNVLGIYPASASGTLWMPGR